MSAYGRGCVKTLFPTQRDVGPLPERQSSILELLIASLFFATGHFLSFHTASAESGHEATCALRQRVGGTSIANELT